MTPPAASGRLQSRIDEEVGSRNVTIARPALAAGSTTDSIRLAVYDYQCQHGAAPTSTAETSTRCRSRFIDAVFVLPLLYLIAITHRNSLGDRAIPEAASRPWIGTRCRPRFPILALCLST